MASPHTAAYDVWWHHQQSWGKDMGKISFSGSWQSSNDFSWRWPATNIWYFVPSSLPLGTFTFYTQMLEVFLLLQQPMRLYQGPGQLLQTAWREKTAHGRPARMLWKGNFLFGFAVWKNFRCRQTLIPSSVLPDKEAASINVAIFRRLFLKEIYNQRSIDLFFHFAFHAELPAHLRQLLRCEPDKGAPILWGGGGEGHQCPYSSVIDIWKLSAIDCPPPPSSVGYLCEPRDAQLYSRPNIESLWQTQQESHLEIKACENPFIPWVETWTTGNKKWHFHFFYLLSAISPWIFPTPVPLCPFSWCNRVLQNGRCLPWVHGRPHL